MCNTCNDANDTRPKPEYPVVSIDKVKKNESFRLPGGEWLDGDRNYLTTRVSTRQWVEVRPKTVVSVPWHEAFNRRTPNGTLITLVKRSTSNADHPTIYGPDGRLIVGAVSNDLMVEVLA